ncbi:conserved phage C-terminal domain-containing protein [Staphylococcus hyicus]|uniref:conserved phage C-terminal domain-containing protein n=1 Tax=Staphylococcus hyicus TaxID=1284 RepID=UPI00211CD948|nr:conserved phage C-terminal domain-containing protein [Staphylococcus hyicus]MCQ9290432.1 conserved phage C-terminal domain-containing protein [Staphylococcus hyicus]MCQ9305674.1 conserved phage C-terminal domain-containing protein [Staphylococcus hyicus]MCQ9308086.1 conserved phage C-terminal domain-containing protein [Staphylococcus hyicus]MCQ9310508.1 conserved phage C-terminal domain-containing protein [Staphylococcus hyicus]
MNNREYISSVITQFSGRNNVIPIPVIYIQITEDYPSAALLNQMIYWSDRTNRKDGYFYKSYNEWFDELHLTEYQVRRATKKLKSFGFVETALKKANGAPTLHYKVDTKEVSEWILKKLKNGNLRNLGMDSEETKESLTEITTETTTEITSKDILSTSSTAYPYHDVIDYLNQQTGKHYKSTTKKNQTVIRARSDEGFNLDDFKKVIDNKVAEWKGTDMEKYLRPETLFGTKFEGYLNQQQSNAVDEDWRKQYEGVF